MISNMAFVFVVLPCIGAAIAGAVLFDWRLAAAALCGALGLLFVAPLLPEVLRVTGGSLVSGIAVGAATTLVVLFWRPVASFWSRMTIAMMAAFTVHFAHLIYTAGRL